MNTENDKSPEETKNTVGQVGSSVDGGFDEQNMHEELVTKNDMKGKKVDADLTNEDERPADQ